MVVWLRREDESVRLASEWGRQYEYCDEKDERKQPIIYKRRPLQHALLLSSSDSYETTLPRELAEPELDLSFTSVQSARALCLRAVDEHFSSPNVAQEILPLLCR